MRYTYMRFPNFRQKAITLSYDDATVYDRRLLNNKGGGKKAWMEKMAGSDKPFLITEYGAGAIYGYRSDACARWTEER